ncbi:MAG: FtsX-like permease family protein [Ruminococcus sp.]|nr:FtsX-like permease family protein [Ruminococcus sp.]
MNNVLFKDTTRTIGKTASRFFSIVAIVALGVSFFAGMNAVSPDMLETAANYYKSSNAADIRIISTAGLTDEDAALISTINGIETVSGEKFVDGVVKVNDEAISDMDGSQLTVRAIAFDVNKAVAASQGENDRSFVNRPQLVSGSWPTQLNECVVDQSKLSTPKEFKIGSIVTIEGNETDVEGSLENTQYKIVGIIRTPLYISYNRGNTTIGTGKLGTFIYVPMQNFKDDYYSALSIKIAGSDAYDPYSDEYSSMVAPYISYLESISSERVSARVESIKPSMTEKVEAGEKEYIATKSEVDDTIEAAKSQVETILDMAENGDKKLAEFKKQYNEKVVEAESKIDSSKLEHSTQYAAWEEKRNQYNETKALLNKYATAETDFKNATTEYNVASLQVNTLYSTVEYLESLVATTRSAVDQLNQKQDTSAEDIVNRFETSGLVGQEVDQIINAVNSFTALGTAEEISAYMEPQLQSLEAQLASAKVDLSQAKTELAEKKAELDKAEQLVARLKAAQAQMAGAEDQLADAEKELKDANYSIQFGELEVLSQLNDLKNQITNYETNLQLAKEKAGTVEAEFEQAKKNAYQKLENAKNRLNYSQNFLAGLDSSKWYVYDRNDALLGFDEYKSTADRAAAISLIFPWVFFLVAAMVCLNSMARMVDDERTQLGSLKALGFRNEEIVMKYVFYAFVASFCGAVAGSFLGFTVFPSVLDACFGIMFDVPSIILRYRLGYAIPSIVIAVASTTFITWWSCRKSLATDASTLMRPKAPKEGKRVWLERFPNLWSKFSFSVKITLRNIFRNKKRFVMAVFSVFGCTALLVAAFGLNNSINTTLVKQFSTEDGIWKYDMQIVLNGSYDTTITDCNALMTVSSRPEISSAMLEYMKVYDSTSEKSDASMETYLLVPEDSNAIGNYIRLKSGKTELTLPQNGAVITKKLAKTLNLSIGDSVIVNVSNDRQVKVPVAGIVENYTFHYIYMTKEVYNALFGSNPKYNYIAANFSSELSDEQKVELAGDLMGEYEISAVSFVDDIKDTLSNTLDAIGYIVIVLIISAALLSFIVMYNLSITNINERMKEIATIKVLGFNNMEVAQYIFRENMLLSVIGTVLGLIGGIGLHRMVVHVGEVNVVMFGRSVGIMGFIYAAFFSMLFSLFVNLVLNHRLRKIDMVESLKSVE